MVNGPDHIERPRVLFVGAFPPPNQHVFGGVVTSCRILLQSSFAARAELVLLDSTQVSNPPPRFLRRLLLAARRFASYLARFERRRPDAVLLFTSVGASVVEKGAMAWYARLRGVPALIFPRGGALVEASRQSRVTRLWVRVALRGARMLLCQGPAWQRFAVDCVGFKIADAPLVPNWTATPALLAIGRDRLPHPIDQPVRLLFVGWLEEKKGVLELIEACRQLVSSSKFVLNIVGEGNASSAAREQVSRAHLESVITFSGWLTGSHLEKAYAEADVFVLPSWAEGLPNAMIEAMAARLAIVVSAVGNIPDVVVDGRDVLLVPPQDISALRGTLMRVIDDPALRRQLGDAAFTTAERQFGAEQAADRLLCAVDDVVSRFGRVRAGQRARV